MMHALQNIYARSHSPRAFFKKHTRSAEYGGGIEDIAGLIADLEHFFTEKNLVDWVHPQTQAALSETANSEWCVCAHGGGKELFFFFFFLFEGFILTLSFSSHHHFPSLRRYGFSLTTSKT